MKIHKRILLLAIGIFINFFELYASPEPYDDAGPSMPNYVAETPRPRGPGGRPSRASLLSASTEPPGTDYNPFAGNHKIMYMTYLARRIKVNLEWRNNEIVAKRCEIDDGYPYHGVPDMKYREENSFLTRACIQMHLNFPVKCVVYITEYSDGRPSEVLGVKAPPKPKPNGVTDKNPRNLNPDALTWFITYKTFIPVDFEVKKNIQERIISVNLKGGPLHQATFEQVIHRSVYTYSITYGGIHFLYFTVKNRPWGAMLPPEWWAEAEEYLVKTGWPYQ